MVRRLVEEQAVDATRRQVPELRARALAGRERARRTQDVVGAEPELRQQRPRRLLRAAEGVDERVIDGEARPCLVQLAEDDAASDLPPARGKRKRPGERAEERGLAAAVSPEDGHAVTAVELEVERPEPEAAALDDCLFESDNQLAARGRRLQLEPQLPRLERLLRAVYSFERSLREPNLRSHGVGAAPAGAVTMSSGL